MGVVKKLGQSLGVIGSGTGGANLSEYGQYNQNMGQAYAQQQQQNASQDQLAQALQQQMQGNGPSVAQQQMQQGLQNAQAQAAGSMANVRGINPALAARLVGQSQAANASNIAGQGGILRAQEQLSAQGQLQNALATQRSQNQGMYGTSGQLQNQMNQNRMGNAMNQAQVSNQQADQFGKLLAAGGSAMMGGGNMMGGGGASNVSTGKMTFASKGGKVLGHPNVEGDSPMNDTVPAMLSPGEIVIPRSASGDLETAKAFLEHVKKFTDKHMPEKGYARVLAKKSEIEGRLKAIEKLCSGGSVKGYWGGTKDGEVEDAENDYITPEYNSMEKEPLTETEVNETLSPVDIDSGAGQLDITPPSIGETQPTVAQEPVPQEPSMLPPQDSSAPLTPEQLAASSVKETAPVTAAPNTGVNTSEYDKAFARQGKAIQDESLAQQSTTKDVMKAQNQMNEDLKTQRIAYDEHIGTLQTESKQIMDEYKANKIDPNRLFSNMSTSQKVMNGIGLLLGSLGGASTGGQNLAANELNKMVDRDIEAQHAEQGQQENLFNFNLKKTGDVNAAYAKSKSDILSVAQAQVEMAKAKATNPLIRANADKLLGQLQLQQAQLHGQIAATQVAKQNDILKRTVNLPPELGGKQVALSESDAKSLNEIVTSSDRMNRNVDLLAEKQKELGHFPSIGPKIRHDIEALKNVIAEDYAKSRGYRLNDSNKESVMKMLPNIGGFGFTDTYLEELKEFKDINKRHLHSAVAAKLPNAQEQFKQVSFSKNKSK